MRKDHDEEKARGKIGNQLIHVVHPQNRWVACARTFSFLQSDWHRAADPDSAVLNVRLSNGTMGRATETESACGTDYGSSDFWIVSDGYFSARTIECCVYFGRLSIRRLGKHGGFLGRAVDWLRNRVRAGAQVGQIVRSLVFHRKRIGSDKATERQTRAGSVGDCSRSTYVGRGKCVVNGRTWAFVASVFAARTVEQFRNCARLFKIRRLRGTASVVAACPGSIHCTTSFIDDNIALVVTQVIGSFNYPA